MSIISPNFEMKRGAMLFSWLSFILQIVTKNTFFLLSTFLMANGGILLLLLGDVLTSNCVNSKASPCPFRGNRWWCTTLSSVPVLIWAASHVNMHLLIFYLLISHLLILHILISHLLVLHLLILHLLILHLLISHILLFRIYLFRICLFRIYLFRIYLFCTYLAAPLLYTTSRPFNGWIGL